jgi:hypothetical protein
VLINVHMFVVAECEARFFCDRAAAFARPLVGVVSCVRVNRAGRKERDLRQNVCGRQESPHNARGFVTRNKKAPSCALQLEAFFGSAYDRSLAVILNVVQRAGCRSAGRISQNAISSHEHL